MTYDMSGKWSTETWFNSGLSNGGRMEKSSGKPLPSCQEYVEKWEAGGVEAEKLGIGVCSSGRIFHGADGPNQPMDGVKIRGTNYARVMSLYADSLYRWDDSAKSPYLSIANSDKSKSMFVVYDDPRECAEKVNYVDKAKLGGLIVWELSGDYLRDAPAGVDRQPLITAIGKVTH
jgi:GH18 family chitinase